MNRFRVLRKNIPCLTALVTADLNKDGNTDMVVVNNGPMKSGIQVLSGDGKGNFQTSFRFQAKTLRPINLVLADLNGDGNPDLVTVDAIHHNIQLFFGKGDGTFQPGEILSGDMEPISAVVDDFNGDRIPDIAVINIASGTLMVYLGKGGGTFDPNPARYKTRKGPFSMVKGDFNRDGMIDLAIANHDDSTVSIFFGTILQKRVP